MGVCTSAGENVRIIKPKSVTTKTSLEETIQRQCSTQANLRKQTKIRRSFLAKTYEASKKQ